jgi:hypothetical protein
VFATVDKGAAQLSGLMARVAGGKPISIVWNSTVSKMSAFTGADWPSAVRHWAEAGGSMTVRHAGITAGDALLASDSGTLSAGNDGRLTGVLDVALRQAPRALGVLGQAGAISPQAADAAATVAAARQDGGDVAHITLNFQAGQTTLGPVAIAPSPKVYDRR